MYISQREGRESTRCTEDYVHEQVAVFGEQGLRWKSAMYKESKEEATNTIELTTFGGVQHGV
jgi:hypothetical protein